MTRLRTYILTLALVVALGTAVQTNAQADNRHGPQCSVATVAGDWGVRGHMLTPDGQEITNIGTYHVNRDGTSSAHGWAYFPGGSTEFSQTGTITINPDCTGTQAWDGDGSFRVVILRNGREIWAQFDSPGGGLVLTLERLHEPF